MAAPAAEDVRFPYDGTLVARAPVGDTALARRALDAAVAVRERVGRLPSHTRRAALLATHEAVASQRADFERLLVLETGKPLVDCRVEVDRRLTPGDHAKKSALFNSGAEAVENAVKIARSY
ncbi:aldehyde dehydrogenase family protein, partial [Streptomyces asiaticus]